jgi:hypothetical protein
MNIDLNTLVTLITIAGAAYFAIAYFRVRLNEKLNNIIRHQDEMVKDLYSENEKMWQRIVTLEKCCKSEKCSTNKDNYYNTTA